jgi:para-nitrobenzyl esterase
LPSHPFSPTAPAISADVPMIIGTTRTETTFMLGFDPKNFALAESELRERVARFAWMSEADASRLIEVYRKGNPTASASDLFFLITTDRLVRADAVAQAERKAAQGGAPAFLYIFAWETPVYGGKLKSPHGADIDFVFGQPGASPLSAAGPARAKLADEVSGAWIAFARNGDPNHRVLPHWPAYGVDERETMVFGRETRLIKDPGGLERRAQAGVPVLQSAPQQHE